LRPEDLPLYITADEALSAAPTVEYLAALQEWLSTVCIDSDPGVVHTYDPLRLYFTNPLIRNRFTDNFREQQGFLEIKTMNYLRSDDQGLFYYYHEVSIEPLPFVCE